MPTSRCLSLVATDFYVVDMLLGLDRLFLQFKSDLIKIFRHEAPQNKVGAVLCPVKRSRSIKLRVPPEAAPFYNHHDALILQNGPFFRLCRCYVPTSN